MGRHVTQLCKSLDSKWNLCEREVGFSLDRKLGKSKLQGAMDT